MKCIALIYVCSLISLVYGVDYDGWLNIKIDHNINCQNEKFCNRGNISVKSTRLGHAVVQQINFNKHHIKQLDDLAARNGFYTLKTIVSSSDNQDLEFFSSLKADAYMSNGLSDSINVWILPNGAVTAVNFQVMNASQPMWNAQEEFKLTSSFYLRNVDQAPVPDTTSYIQKLEREREAREKGDLKDNRSFIAKYWMYIVPIAIFVMISGASNPDPAGQAR